MILKEVKPGNSVTIRKLNSTGSVKKKLMDMGLTKNTEIYVRKVAGWLSPVKTERKPAAVTVSMKPPRHSTRTRSSPRSASTAPRPSM